MNISIIGYGYWGPNLLRNFFANPGCNVKSVAEPRTDLHLKIKKQYPSVRCLESANDVINDPDVDAIVIATPVFTHYTLAKAALLNDKHVLLEKPMASSVREAEELIEIAVKRDLVLMVDHTFLYTGAVRKMKALIDNGEIGAPQYFDSTRINLGLFQSDINVLWDLAPHDISILLYLISSKPTSVNAVGISHTRNNIENVAYMTVNYEEGLIAHFNCSWASPVKVRSTFIGGSKKMLVFNDIEPSEKVRVYDTSYVHYTDEDKNKILVDYRIGDVYIPKLDTQEALAGVAQDFINAITEKAEPVSNKELGLEVVRILEASGRSIKNSGQQIKL